ncbi:MAG TPA: rhodanese-like domain-containing protein, partial [Candidatus Angelobacter sp.]|nr:rhodanese-like domain-containing protein [Candidatus Angelobacter sp.]
MLTTVAVALAMASAQTVKPSSGADDIPAASQIQPSELTQAMKATGAQKPVVLYVGPKAFYAQAHIPGSEFIGPVGKPEGMDKLRARAASLPKDGAVVIYCGCCPWDHCPNVRPAIEALKQMGFTRVRAMYVATNFKTDWIDAGYPV